jgi:hypothetical protein
MLVASLGRGTSSRGTKRTPDNILQNRDNHVASALLTSGHAFIDAKSSAHFIHAQDNTPRAAHNFIVLSRRQASFSDIHPIWSSNMPHFDGALLDSK